MSERENSIYVSICIYKSQMFFIVYCAMFYQLALKNQKEVNNREVKKWKIFLRGELITHRLAS